VSINALGWVLSHSEERYANRLVLIALADHAGPDGEGAFPSLDTIAQKSGLSKRHARRSLRMLEEHGAIGRSGVRLSGTVTYCIHMGRTSDALAPGGRTSDAFEVDQLSPEPSLNRPFSSTSSSVRVYASPQTLEVLATSRREGDQHNNGLSNNRSGAESYAVRSDKPDRIDIELQRRAMPPRPEPRLPEATSHPFPSRGDEPRHSIPDFTAATPRTGPTHSEATSHVETTHLAALPRTPPVRTEATLFELSPTEATSHPEPGLAEATDPVSRRLPCL
jgi:hypothetical protein